MKEIEITEDVYKTLKVGDRVKYHNTYEWTEDVLDQWDIDNKEIITGIGNERTNLISIPTNENYRTFVLR
jgi:hypothetical protein